MSYTYEFPMTSTTATMALFYKNKVLLGLRGRTSTFANYWSLPGGFLEVGKENVKTTAIRETFEETKMVITTDQLNLFYVSSDPNTDPRAHVTNICYFIDVTEEQYNMAVAGDDLADLDWVDADEATGYALAFDHNTILLEAIAFRKRFGFTK